MILAGIDIGTNTIRLLVSDTSDTAHRELHSGRIITRLGQNLDRTGVLAREAQERSLAALSRFAGVISRFPVVASRAVGTSALRNASNAEEFINAAKEKTGLDIRVINGEEEARLTLLGVMRAVRQAGERSTVVIDIGGGSTEVIWSGPLAGIREASLPLGAVYLTERLIHHDPPTAEEVDAVRRAVSEELRRPGGTAGPAPAPATALIGTAGTITTLAAMDLKMTEYDPGRINGHVLTREALDRMIDRLIGSTLEARRNMPGLEKGREDIILAGAIVAQEIMEQWGAERMIVSDWGLREGIVFDLYEKVKQP
jgi:exopolyphosphatase/guanosine-5'-triphosphate,3'-diphosphate pyrophosphatase